MNRNRIAGAIAASAIGIATLGAIGTQASVASAKVNPVITATTHLVNRDDIGGSGKPWAHDTMNRVVKLVFLGKSKDPLHAAKPFMYYATLQDKGTFLDIPGKPTPNQGGKFLGRHLPALQFSGPVNGTATYPLFFASAKAHSGLVPSELKGAKLNKLFPDSDWPKLFFAPGTKFAGVSESPYDYNYYAHPLFKIVKGKKVLTGYRAHWENASFNGFGQLVRDGNIR